MLENYDKNKDKVIYQKEINKIQYDVEYVNSRYSIYPTTNSMSHLRLGYLLGLLQFIPNNILDVGYGNGDFLNVASNIIPNCYGNDIEPAYPLIDKIKFVNNIYDDEYDVVCFFDSLEHFDNIYEIKNIKTEYIYISVPWCHYVNDEWFKNWKHRRENEHLWHFDLPALVNFMKSINFKYIAHSNIEDVIRKNDSDLPNILTALFKKM